MHRAEASAVLRKLRQTRSAASAFRSSITSEAYKKSASAPEDAAESGEASALIKADKAPSGKDEMSSISFRSSASAPLASPLQKDLHGLKDLFFGSYLNLLLVLSPFALWSHYAEWGAKWVFFLNFFVMVPLANILGISTEILAMHTGQTIGGLVNATFGNAVEVVIAVFALGKGEIVVVQSSLVGSILSNLLLVLGCCFIAGGMRFQESEFNATGATANSSLLMLASFAMLLPTYCSFQIEDSALIDSEKLTISHIAAIFLFLMYIQLLFFQLRTHKSLFEGDEEEEEPELSLTASCAVLLGTTLLVALFSEFLVGSIDEFTKELQISKSFVGIIILPIVGNAVEHVTAVKVALNGKMELAMGVAVGSATQVAVFVVPVVVIAGWIMEQPMSLAFPSFETMVYLFSVIIVYAIVADGKSNWLEGSMLLTTYILIAVTLLWIKV